MACLDETNIIIRHKWNLSHLDGPKLDIKKE